MKSPWAKQTSGLIHPTLGDTPLLSAFDLACPSGPGLVGFWFPNVRTIQPLGTHARMLAETALIADSLQLDTFVHSAWRTPVVLPSAVDDRRDFVWTLGAWALPTPVG